jgi:hypothetical protein
MTIRVLQSDDEVCEACVAAERVHRAGGIYFATCRGCEVRRAACAPPRERDAIFAAQPEGEAQAFIADTRKEFARLRALRGATT